MKKIEKLKWVILYYIFLPFSILYYKKCKNTWLISERGDEARDNGYYFYKYLKKNHPDINVKYIISKDSKDIDKIDREDIVYFRSFSHYIYFINSKYLISTHNMGYSPLFWVFSNLDDKKLLFTRGKRIFIQHGIIYNTISSLINKHIDLFITSSDEERKFVIDNFHYSDNVVKCTGLARYDYFNSKRENFILVMPTWRRYLNNAGNKDFINSEYYKVWNSFLNNESIKEILLKNNMKIVFYPHYEMQKFIKMFNNLCENIVIADAKDYSIHDLINDCKLFVTDYSSTAFDVAYNKKPLIYYQFDFNSFYSSHYNEGYINLKNNGFGKVVDNEQELVNEILNIINNNFINENRYINRINKFYKYRDNNNCDRIFSEIVKLDGK